MYMGEWVRVCVRVFAFVFIFIYIYIYIYVCVCVSLCIDIGIVIVRKCRGADQPFHGSMCPFHGRFSLSLPSPYHTKLTIS